MILFAAETGRETSVVARTYDPSSRLIEETIALNGKVLQQTKQQWTPSSRTLTIGNHTRELHYTSGLLKKVLSQGINLEYEYSPSRSLLKKTSPLSTATINYNGSGLPSTIITQFLGRTYTETLQWTPVKLASHEKSYPNQANATYTYTPRGFIKTANQDSFIFDFDTPGRGIRTSASDNHVTSVDPFGKVLVEDTTKLTYDLLGQVIAKGDQTLCWDSWGRLIEVTSNAYTWKASYDPFGRRLQTSYASKMLGITLSPVMTTSLYDPETEFLEIGVIQNNKTLWKFYGSRSCDALSDDAGNAAILIHDIQGNLVCTRTQDQVTWKSEYPTPYGPRGPPTKDFTLLSYAQSLAWQSKRADPTGLLWMGARHYDSKSGRFLSPDPIGYPACLDLYAYANGDPINYFDPDGRFFSAVYNNHQFQGGIRALAGGVEATVGASVALIPSGFTQVFGGALVLHGADNFQAGIYQALSNHARDPLTVQLLQKAGMSHNAAHVTNDLGMMLGTMGGAAAIKATSTALPALRVPPSIAKTPVELNRFHTAAQELSEVGQNNIRILRGWAKSKGWVKAKNFGGPEMWGQYIDGTFKWNLKIKPELSLRQGLSARSGISRFDARLGNVKPFEYLNPFTGIGGKEIQLGRHIPLEMDLWIK